MSDLIERLRQLADNTGKMTWVGDMPMPASAVLHLSADRIAELEAENARLKARDYVSFTDGMEAAAEICASLAETTYDDADAFEAATGCEAAIMRVVKHQRKEQQDASEGEK